MSKAISKLALTAGFVLAMAFTVSYAEDDSSAFAGKWVRDDGSESMELFEDGTGIAKKGKESVAISWKVMGKRFVITTTVLGSSVSEAQDYEISGNKLTFTDDNGKSETYVKNQKGKIEGKVLIDNRDGKKYKTVIIGSQTWMAENLNYNADGSKCYKDNENNCQKYGRTYDWKTALKACPSGWHLPSINEYKLLDNFVGGENVAGKKLKATSGWNLNNRNNNGTDDYGFSALPGGYGGFFGTTGDGRWWSANGGAASAATLAYSRTMDFDKENFYWYSSGKQYLYSVRCVQD
jgi:uncharacterized protein (TIGR02145 family)